MKIADTSFNFTEKYNTGDISIVCFITRTLLKAKKFWPNIIKIINFCEHVVKSRWPS